MSDVNETKAPDEYELEIDKLTLTKTGYERNRNLTGCVVVLLGYYIYTGICDGDGTWWFYLLMGAMFLVASFILYRSWKETKALQREIDELTAEKKARDAAADAGAPADAAAEAEEPAAIEADAAPADESDAVPAIEAESASGADAAVEATPEQASDADKA